MNELQSISHHKESLENISSDVNMNIAQEKEKTSITTPTNTSAAITLNTMVFQSEEIHTYPEVQAYERKNTISKRVVDETTLRIYFQDMLILLVQICFHKHMLKYQQTFLSLILQLHKRGIPIPEVRFVFNQNTHLQYIR